MPIYEYQCGACSAVSEILQKVSDAPATVCPKCGESALKKKLSAPAFRLKGSGWYETDFKTGAKKNLAGDGPDSGGEKKGGEKDAKSLHKAVDYYRAAADKGFAPAQYNLGVMYEKGRGVMPNIAQAIKWWRKAAEGNYPYAQLNLGVLYDVGRGVERNHKIAISYYRSAAKQGDMRAVYRLGTLYEHCDQPKPDLEKAFMWFTVAEEKGLKNVSQHLRFLSSKMAPKSISRARTAASAWINGHPTQ